MDHNTIVLIIQLVVVIASFLVGKYLLPNLSANDIASISAKIEIIIKYADKFVSWANYFMKDATGSQRMEEVVKQLEAIAKKYKLDISKEELTAIVQKAYDAMKAGEKAADIEQTKADAVKAAAEASKNQPFPIIEDGTVFTGPTWNTTEDNNPVTEFTTSHVTEFATSPVTEFTTSDNHIEDKK